jgi:hypothetical protein
VLPLRKPGRNITHVEITGKIKPNGENNLVHCSCSTSSAILRLIMKKYALTQKMTILIKKSIPGKSWDNPKPENPIAFGNIGMPEKPSRDIIPAVLERLFVCIMKKIILPRAAIVRPKEIAAYPNPRMVEAITIDPAKGSHIEKLPVWLSSLFLQIRVDEIVPITNK